MIDTSADLAVKKHRDLQREQLFIEWNKFDVTKLVKQNIIKQIAVKNDTLRTTYRTRDAEELRCIVAEKAELERVLTLIEKGIYER